MASSVAPASLACSRDVGFDVIAMVGTGGANHTSFVTTMANSQVRDDNTFGILKLTLHPTSYDWQFIPEAGKTFTDSGSTLCH